MAIQQLYESPTGLSIKEAYHKIIKVQVDYIADVAIFWVAVYVSEGDRDNDRAPLYIRKVTIDKVDDTLKVREKLYDYLKTTNDYQESKDI